MKNSEFDEKIFHAYRQHNVVRIYIHSAKSTKKT